MAWEQLQEMKENETVVTIKVAQAVNGGVTTYLEGIRAFIPASQLSLQYVENLDEWVGKQLSVIIIELDEEKQKLILSAKEIARRQAQQEYSEKLNRLQKGYIATGTVERIEPYGCFVTIGDGLSGLVHISQIAWKHIKSPNEIVKLGDEVKVKILDIADGKIKLSMKAANEPEEEEAEEKEALEYLSGEEASTGLGSLFAGITFDE